MGTLLLRYEAGGRIYKQVSHNMLLLLQAALSEDQSLYTQSLVSGTFFLYKNVTQLMNGLELKCDLKLQFPCWSTCGKI